MKILITGSAGFIGMHVAEKFLKEGATVVGLDNINDYYDPELKKNRNKRLKKFSNYIFYKINIEDKSSLEKVFNQHQIDYVIHLAAQAGVRYSIINPYAYIESNINGFMNILEQCRHNKIKHLVYASSSSVYGGNTKLPFSEHDNVDHPVSLYAATKKSNELMAHRYSHLYKLPTTGLRFFTVYGPWGRPDMALFLFTSSIIKGEKIDVYNNGKMIRDFTYIDDIVNGLSRVVLKIPKSDENFNSDKPDPAKSNAPYRIFNIGNSNPENLMTYIECIENSINKKASMNMMPMQAGDVRATSASVEELNKWVGYKPGTNIQVGVKKFITWYLDFYKQIN